MFDAESTTDNYFVEVSFLVEVTSRVPSLLQVLVTGWIPFRYLEGFHCKGSH